MADAPTTRPSLLVRLRDLQDRQAWDQFVDLYAPIIYGYARKQGLQEADAADLTQTVLRQVVAHMGRFHYDPQRGSFRGWLFTIVRRKLMSLRTHQNGRCQGTGDPVIERLLQDQPAPTPQDTATWEREYRQGLLAWAAGQVRPLVQATTWQAFWQTAVEGKRPQAVAAVLGISPAAVYLARGRVMARLREEIQQKLNEE